MKGPQHGSGFNPFAAGKRHYGGGRSHPNQGKTMAEGKKGYTKRDAQLDALKKRLGKK